MTIRVLVNDFIHRTLALATDTHVLSFKHTHTPSRVATSASSLPLQNAARRPDTPRCMVEFTEKSADTLKGYRTLTIAKGTLGLITLNNDVFICVVTGSTEVATVRPGETVQKIFAVEFYCLNRSDYEYGSSTGHEPNPYPSQVFTVDEHAHSHHGGNGMEQDGAIEHPFAALKKLLSTGSFYYSLNFDLTRRLQDRLDTNDTVDISSLDEGLLWNSYMIDPLLSFRSRLSANERHALDKSGMLTSVIRGFVQTLTISPSSSPIRQKASHYPATLTLISRLSARRAGTRFNSRGIDDAGNVANFVETETVFWSPTGICFSYVQVRGSIPVFWESSSSLIPGQQKIQITRSPEATQMSFDKHFDALEKTYGSVHIVNLLSPLKPGEAELTDRYNLHINRSPLRRQEKGESSNHSLLQDTQFDFHEHARVAGGYSGAQQIRPHIDSSAEAFIYFLSEEVEEMIVVSGRQQVVRRPLAIMQQTGVFRVNCLDCLDRTNLVQGLISQIALELFLGHRSESPRATADFWLRHSSLWADNGDTLSKIYAGTGALKSSYTRHGKMSFGGLMADARKSATRLYVNHFEDKGRQNTVDLLLGRLVGQGEVELFDPINDWVVDQLMRRREEYESEEKVRVWVGTYNLNGRMMTDIRELRIWLDVRKNEGYEIVVVGFQEIVELSPQQIMSTDPRRRIVWEGAVKECLNGSVNENFNSRSEDDYVLLRSGQLVGAALMIFVKVSALNKISNVEGAIKKTGMSGMAGNKGAVAVRMDIEGTSVCFVTAHLAAGFGNYEERNRDYQTISAGLRFQRDRKIDDHELVVWAGDFNYRIGLTYDQARSLVAVAQKAMRSGGPANLEAEEAIGKLYENDQLNIQMVVGHCFRYFQEGRVKFLPTYKFDLGKDDYDSSEKARIPAWTDRILWRVKPGTSSMRLLEYTSVQGVRFSDHRPVMAGFEMGVRKIDEPKKSEITSKLYEKRQKEMRNRSGSDVHGENIDSSHSPGSDVEDDIEDLMGYQSIQEGLPPASSDRRKWWLDGDHPVRSQIGPPRDGMILNEGRNGNPWKDGGEDEWVEVDNSTASARNGFTGSPRPQPPPPRKGAHKPTASLAAVGDRKSPKSGDDVSVSLGPFIPASHLANNRLSTSLSRTASIGSTTTTSTMVTARSGTSDAKSTPPPKPSKPSALRSNSISKQTTSPLPSPPTITDPPYEHSRMTVESPQSEKPPPLPQRTNTSSTIASAKADSALNTRRTPPPLVQPRRLGQLHRKPGDSHAPSSPPIKDSTIPTSVSRTAAVMTEQQRQPSDIMGQDNTELAAWKPLLPGR